MKIIDTATWKPGLAFETYQVYNGLDCCLTFEIHEELPPPPQIYSFNLALQGPALEMMMRGIKVDGFERQAAIAHLERQDARLRSILQRYALATWGKPLNPTSHHQTKSYFYEYLALPVQLKRNASGERVPTTNRDALEKLEVYPHARPVIRVLLAISDIAKQLSILRSEVDFDGRMRTSYNLTGTETDRWSSSKNAYGTGTNLQNIPDKLRRIFVSDPGRKLAYLDLEQAESWLVGIICFRLFGATNYIQAIQSGDLHTTVSRLVWPNLPWTGDIRSDREIAERPFYRDFSYRDMGKRGGHGTNYYGTDYTMAKHLKVDRQLITDFQRSYFAAFPEIPDWHKWCSETLTTTRTLVDVLGRERQFLGRERDDTTLREFIAAEPQGVVGKLLNLALWRVWAKNRITEELPEVCVMGQLHDAILIDYPETSPENELALLQKISSLMRTPLTVTYDRQIIKPYSPPSSLTKTFEIPSDIAVGWNWGKFNDDPKKGGINLGGLRKISTGKLDTRTGPPSTGLDRVIPDFN